MAQEDLTLNDAAEHVFGLPALEPAPNSSPLPSAESAASLAALSDPVRDPNRTPDRSFEEPVNSAADGQSRRNAKRNKKRRKNQRGRRSSEAPQAAKARASQPRASRPPEGEPPKSQKPDSERSPAATLAETTAEEGDVVASSTTNQAVASGAKDSSTRVERAVTSKESAASGDGGEDAPKPSVKTKAKQKSSKAKAGASADDSVHDHAEEAAFFDAGERISETEHRTTMHSTPEEDFPQVLPLTPEQKQHHRRFIPYVAGVVGLLAILAGIGLVQRGGNEKVAANSSRTDAVATEKAVADRPAPSPTAAPEVVDEAPANAIPAETAEEEAAKPSQEDTDVAPEAEETKGDEEAAREATAKAEPPKAEPAKPKPVPVSTPATKPKPPVAAAPRPVAAPKPAPAPEPPPAPAPPPPAGERPPTASFPTDI